MATNERNGEKKSGSSIYICLIIFKNPLFGTQEILTLGRERERKR